MEDRKEQYIREGLAGGKGGENNKYIMISEKKRNNKKKTFSLALMESVIHLSLIIFSSIYS